MRVQKVRWKRCSGMSLWRLYSTGLLERMFAIYDLGKKRGRYELISRLPGLAGYTFHDTLRGAKEAADGMVRAWIAQLLWGRRRSVRRDVSK